MKRLILLLFLLTLPAVGQQIATPPVRLTGPVGPGGPAFPALHSGTISMTDADYNMLYPDQSASVIRFTSSVPLTTTRNIIAPQAAAIFYEFTLVNQTTGGQAIRFGATAGTGVLVPNGQAVEVVSNGTNYMAVGSTGGGPGAGPIVGNIGIGVNTTSTPGTTVLTGTVIDAISDCHLVGDGVTDDSAALQACIDNHNGYRILLRRTSPSCTPVNDCRPVASYYMGTTTIQLHGSGTVLSGEGNGHWGAGGTPIYWAPDTVGIVMTQDCASCEISNLYLSGPDNLGHPAGTPYASYDQCWLGTSETSGNFGMWPGIFMTGSSQIVRESTITCFNGNGISIRSAGACNPNAPPPIGPPRAGATNVCGQPDLWRVTGVFVDGNRGNGMLIEGSDTNVGTSQATNNFGNELWGIHDHNSFGDAHISPHTNGNGRTAIGRGGINSKQAYWIARTANVVTACFIGAAGSAAPGFAVGNLISLSGASEPTLDSGPAPFTLTYASTAAGEACPLVTGQANGFGGYVRWNQTGPDVALISIGPPIGIVSNISSIARTGNVVTVTAAATSTTHTPNDIKLGTWVRIIGTGNAAYDNHVFRANTATAGAGNAVTITFPYLGPNIVALSTGYLYSASSADIDDPLQNIRTVMDGAMTAGSTYLTSETAQFSYRQGPPSPTTLPNPYNCGLANNVGCGAPVVVHGAGAGGADLVTYITAVDYTTRVTLHDAAVTTVTNAQVDMGGAWKGGAYWSYTATWINPYLEYTQTTLPVAMTGFSTMIGGNIDPFPSIPGSPTGPLTQGFTDPWLGTPVAQSGTTLQGIQQIATFTDVPNGLTIRTGLTHNVNTSIDFTAWDQSAPAPAGTSHQIFFAPAAGGGVSMADNQFTFANHNLYLRSLDPAATSANYMFFGSGSPTSYQFMGLCPGTGTQSNAGLLTLNSAGTGLTLDHPCTATATTNYSSPPFIIYGHYWNTTAAATMGWQLQANGPANGAAATVNTLRISPVGITNLASPGVANLSTPMVSLDSLPYATLNAMKANASLTAGTQAFCNNCVVTAPTGCSVSNPSACVCAQGTGTTIARYINYENGGLNWYCAEPGAAAAGTGTGNVSTSGTITNHGTAVFNSATTLVSVGPGLLGQVLTSTGPTTPPTYQNPTGGTPTIVSPFVVPSINGTQNLTITVPNSGGGNPSLSSSTGTIDIAHLLVTDLAGAGSVCLQADSLGNVIRTGYPCNQVAISDLVAANRINTIFNGIYQQNWLWHFPSTSTNQSGLNFSEQDLGAGTGNSVVTISSFAGSPTNPLSVTAGSNGSLNYRSTGQLAFTGAGGIVSSTGITSDVSVSSPTFFTCTAANPCITPASAPLGRATGGEPLATIHLHDFSSTVASNGQVPIWNSSLNQYVPGPVNGSGGSINPSYTFKAVSNGYTITAADFSSCVTLTYTGAAGITVNLPAAMPPAGQCVRIFNYSSYFITVNHASHTVNGGSTSSTTIYNGSSPLFTNVVMYTSDGTGFFAERYFTSAPFGELQAGTSQGRAFVIGNGGSMSTTGTGVINANQVNGTTVPVSATSLASNASGQLIAGSGGGGPVSISDLTNATAEGFTDNGFYQLWWQWDSSLLQGSSRDSLALADMATSDPNSSGGSILSIISAGNFRNLLDVESGNGKGWLVDGTGDLNSLNGAVLSSPVQLTTGSDGFGNPLPVVNAPSLATDANGHIIAGTGGGGGGINPPYALAALTNNYTFTAADFSNCRTYYYSGTTAASVVLPTTVPPSGQCLKILNYGSGAITITGPAGTLTNGGQVTQAVLPGVSGANVNTNAVMYTSTGSGYLSERYFTATPFGSILGGSTTQSFIIGNGGSLDVFGTGTINANQVNAAPVPPNLTSVATNASGQFIAGTGGGGGLVYSTPLLNQTVGTTAPATLSTTTMVTPTANTTYRVEVDVKQTNTPACTTFPSVAVRVSYTDADTGAAIPGNQGGLVLYSGNGNNGSVSYAVFTTAAPGQGNSWYSVPMSFYAQSGQPVQLIVWQQAAGASCTTSPTYTVRPYLYRVQ